MTFRLPDADRVQKQDEWVDRFLDKWGIPIIVAALLLCIAVWSAVVIVAWHFLGKWW